MTYLYGGTYPASGDSLPGQFIRVQVVLTLSLRGKIATVFPVDDLVSMPVTFFTESIFFYLGSDIHSIGPTHCGTCPACTLGLDLKGKQVE